MMYLTVNDVPVSNNELWHTVQTKKWVILQKVSLSVWQQVLQDGLSYDNKHLKAGPCE